VPFTGWPDETGAGAGLGFNCNVLLSPRVDGDGYLALLSRVLEGVSSQRCDAVVVSLGFDTAEGDISGDATLRGGDYRRVGAQVASLGLPVVGVLEGGYVVETLGANLAEWIHGFRDERAARD
jgi:acetoin utilization deacetylase AcuC-like enzyme